MTRALDLYQAGVWRVWLFMAVVFTGAGGLGLSGAAGFIGLMLLPFLVLPALQSVRATPRLPALLAAAIAWSAVSLVWSGYDRPDQAIKLALLTPLFVLVVFAASRFSPAQAQGHPRYGAILLGLAAGYFLLEAVAGVPIATAIKVNFENYTDQGLALAHADRILARGVTGFVIVALPVAIALWTSGHPLARAGAGLIILAGLVGGWAFGVEANLLALIGGLFAALVAWRMPGRALMALGFLSAGLLLLAPVYLGILTAVLPDSIASSLPLSWHQRLEIWSYALEQIAAAPIWGHGLDAGRVLGEDAVLRGVEFNTLPLHAHNFGLTIWLETGLIGASLYSATLGLAGWMAARVSWSNVTAAGLAASAMALLATVLVGSGIWQEWLHGALALGAAFAVMAGRKSA